MSTTSSWPTVRGSWRPEKVRSARLRRNVVRVVVTLLSLSLFALLLWLLFQPFWHPNTHIFIARGAEIGSLRFVSPPYPDETDAGFHVLQDTLRNPEGYPGPFFLPLSESPDKLATLRAYFREITITPQDVLIVYLNTMGIVVNQEPVLVTGSFDVSNPAAGVYPVSEFLKQLKSSRARHKLLILDSGRSGTDPRLGDVVNEFPEQLRRVVEATNDSSLWVLNSNDSFERSYDSPKLRRSVFTFFVTRGLSGAADSNQDQVISLRELESFVSRNVQVWVRQTRGPLAQQTPQLLCGSSSARQPQDIRLLSVSRIPRETRNELLSETLDRESREELGKAAKSQVLGRLEQSTRGLRAPLAPLNEQRANIDAFQTQRKEKQQAQEAAEGPSESDTEPDSNAANDQPADPDAKAGGAGEESEPRGKTGQELVQLRRERQADVDRLWVFAESLMQRSSRVDTPIDYAPRLWRQFLSQLITAERLSRQGSVESIEQLPARITRELGYPERVFGGLVDASAGDALSNQIYRAAHDPVFDLVPSTSLYASSQRAQTGHVENPELVAFAEAYQSALNADERTELDQLFAEKWKPAFESFDDLRLARQLLPVEELSWPQLREALHTRWSAEELATDPVVAWTWVQPLLRSTDQIRLAGEQDLLDRIDAQWLSRAFQRIRLADQQYERRRYQLESIRTAEQLRNDVLHRIPYYFRWFNSTTEIPDRSVPNPAELTRLFFATEQLDRLLSRPLQATELQEATFEAERRITRLQQLSAEVAELETRIQQPMSETSLKLLTSAPVEPGDYRAIEQILATPLLLGRPRIELGFAGAQIEDRLASSITEATRPSALNPRVLAWESIQHRLLLQKALIESLGNGLPTASSTLREFDSEFARLVDFAEQRKLPEAWAALKAIELLLQEFFAEVPNATRELAAQAELNEDLAQRMDQLRQADRWYRLLPGETDETVADDRAPRRLLITRYYSHLMWLRRRLVESGLHTSSELRARLERQAEDLSVLAAKLPYQPQGPAQFQLPLDVTGPDQLVLVDPPSRDVEFVFRNRSAQAMKLWLVLSYNEEVLDVAGPAGWQWYHEVWGESHSSDVSTMPESLLLEPGNVRRLSFRVTRRASALEPTQLVLKVIKADREEDVAILYQPLDDNVVRHNPEAMLRDGVHLVRKDVRLQLPSPADVILSVDGVDGTWESKGRSTTLLPFPNRSTTYVWRLSNRTSLPREVGLQLFAARTRMNSSLQGSMPPNDANRIIADYAGVAIFQTNKLALPANGSLEIPFMPASGETAAAAPSAGSMPPEGGAAVISELPSGVLVVIRDPTANRVSLSWIDVKAQRPRRYVVPQVNYNAITHELEIRVRGLPGRLPSSEIDVVADFGNQLSPANAAQLAGTLAAPDFETKLFAKIPPGPGQRYEFQLHVDGYPRAFRYSVVCDQTQLEIPEQTDRLAMRLLKPADNSHYRAPMEHVRAKFEVDAPVGSFERGEDYIDIGIDLDQDREFIDEWPQRLYSDRQVQVSLVNLDGLGRVTLKTEVSDFEMDVRVAGLRNQSADLLGRVRAAGNVATSNSVPLYLDAAPPVLDNIQISPADSQIHQEEPMQLVVVATDPSGVAQVEAYLDVGRDGTIPEKAKTVMGESTGRREWSLELPTLKVPLGPVAMFLKMTDRVGNAEVYGPFEIQVLPPRPKVDDDYNTLRGQVRRLGYGVERATVEVWSTNLTELYHTTETDEEGRYLIEDVRTGNYLVLAKVFLSNNPYDGRAEVFVPARPKKSPYTVVNLKSTRLR